MYPDIGCVGAHCEGGRKQQVLLERWMDEVFRAEMVITSNKPQTLLSIELENRANFAGTQTLTKLHPARSLVSQVQVSDSSKYTCNGCGSCLHEELAHTCSENVWRRWFRLCSKTSRSVSRRASSAFMTAASTSSSRKLGVIIGTGGGITSLALERRDDLKPSTSLTSGCAIFGRSECG